VYNIFKAGYSRIPVYDKDRNDIVSLILAKDLIFVDPEDDIPISNFVDMFGRRPIFVWHDDKLGVTLSTFRNERAHLALVRDVENQGDGDPFYKVVGLITLEDIIEEILGTEIEDETDFTSETGTHGPLRDIDLARLKSLSSKITDETLSADEIEAITNYLDDNVPEIHEVIKGGKDALKALVQKSGVLTLKKKSPMGEKAHHEDYIFRKGKVSNSCIVVLQGRVRIIRGEKDDVEEIKGPWTTIAAEALSVKEGTFIPDFSACIESEYLRFVRITTFQEEIHSEGWAHRSKLQKLRSQNVLTTTNTPVINSTHAAHHNRTIYTSPLRRRATHNAFNPSLLTTDDDNNDSRYESLAGRSISTGGLMRSARQVPEGRRSGSNLGSLFGSITGDVGGRRSEDARPLLSVVSSVPRRESHDEVESKASAMSDDDIPISSNAAARNVRFTDVSDK
jgi:CRP-like cAMP-binding protein